MVLDRSARSQEVIVARRTGLQGRQKVVLARKTGLEGRWKVVLDRKKGLQCKVAGRGFGQKDMPGRSLEDGFGLKDRARKVARRRFWPEFWPDRLAWKVVHVDGSILKTRKNSEKSGNITKPDERFNL